MKQDKKKIVVIGLKGIPAYGGAATVGEAIINELKPKYDFTVLSLSSHTDKSNICVNGIKQVVFNAPFKKSSINTYLYYIHSMFYALFHKFDLVFLHHCSSGFITPFLRIKYKVVVVFHGCLINKTDPKFSKLVNHFNRYSEKLNIKYANVVVSVSKLDADILTNKYMRHIEYIPNGVSLPHGILPISKYNDYLLFSAGRIYDVKGLHLLIEALNLINYPGKVLVIGDLDQVPSYKKLILSSSRKLNIDFLGLIKNKQELFAYIKSSSLFCFPSLTEAMSMMLLEVVSNKIPIIASNIPANTNIFNEDEMLFFESENSEDLASKIQYALNNKNNMILRSQKAYCKLVNQYLWSAISLQYDAIFTELIEAHR